MASGKRTIAAVTGSRAEFGLLKLVLRAIEDHPRLTLRVIVAGAHWTSGTWRDVEAAGYEIAAQVAMQERGKSGRTADVAAVGRGVSGFGEVFERLGPDCVLVLGDRVEALAAVTAASVGGYRLAHIHGGDRAEGVADESMRHAISKLAHLHFAATAQSRRRLVRMGEPEDRVFNLGSPAVDGLRGVRPAEDAEAPGLIVLQHPIGASEDRERRWMRRTLRATAGWRDRRLVMAPNGDPGCEGIRAALREAGVEPVEHLPRERWLSLLAGAEVIVGNSSAGLIEAAALKTGCVNVGPRQSGREKPRNVTDCEYGERAVRSALREVRGRALRRMRHPYGNGRAGERIAEALGKISLQKLPLHKHNSY
jgi:UDP-hydrolysing UDP-N-acetyl-D-glucosamine 2-epimerase